MTDTCGCCEGIEQITPITIINRPGLNALLYRVGTHATFFETMLARLSSLNMGTDANPNTPLQSLTTRSTSDPAIALLDAWAIMGDVFTFYQERIANEGYLRTATHRRSILELARLVGYKLRPGVASSTYLAYTLQTGYNTLIPAGSRAQNIPAAGQLPQSFETSLDLQARSTWNNMSPRMSLPQNITMLDTGSIDTNASDGAVYLAGTSTALKPNDPLLFVFGDDSNQQIFAHAQAIAVNSAAQYTRVTFLVTFTPDVYNVSLEKLVARYLDVSAFGLQSTDTHVQTVVSDLHTIQQAQGFPQLLTSTGFDPNSPIATAIGQALTDADDLYDEAVNNGGGKGGSAPLPNALQIASWSGGLFNDLTSSMKQILDFATSSSGGEEAPQAVSTRRGRFIALASPLLETLSDAPPRLTVTTGLNTLLNPLTQSANIQPASSARLPRKIENVLARNGDMASQLLTTFLPQISSTLYTAYSQAQVTPPTPLQNLYAQRVKAAPFGSSAPKQVVTTESYDSVSGKVTFATSYKEWPIAETASLSIQISPYDSSNPTGVTVELSFKQGSVADSATIQSFPKTVSLPANNPAVTLTVSLTTGGSQANPTLTAIVITIVSGLTLSDVTLTVTPDSGAWSVALDKNDKAPVAMTYDDAGNFIISLSAPSSTIVLDLDARYDHIVPETWVVIEATSALPAPFATKAVKIQRVETIARADYGVSAKVTRLTLYGPWLKSEDLQGNPSDLSLYRGITVYAQSEALALADLPVTDDVAGDTVELDTLYDGLQSGRYVVVSGERTDILQTTGVTTSELMMLQSVTQEAHQYIPNTSAMQSSSPTPIPLPGDTTHTTLHFATPLAYTYKRESVVINGNVVAATQGETQNQVLGSGSGGTAMQQFSLAKSPLTYIPAVTPTGEESTLQVFVNNVRWQEVDSLDTALATDRVYTTQADNQDKVTITFGNGVHGARLPTGNENVKAIYRTGIGTSGNVDVGKISQLVSKPLGVKGVNNPVAATGGADRESRDQARANVPLAATSLGRIVSIQDYADFARTFAGIGKASAAYFSDGMQQVVHLTIAGQDDIPIDPTSSLYQSLLQSLHTFGDPGIPLLMAQADVKVLIISVRVSIQPDYLFEDVSAALRSALLAAFSFEKRNLGQPVYQSEVLSVMQQVTGVAYVDIDILDAITQQQLSIALQQIQADALQAANTGQQPDNPPDLATLLGLRDRRVVPSALAQPDSAHPGNILPAQLVFLSPDVQDTLILNQLTALTFKPAKHKHHHAGM